MLAILRAYPGYTYSTLMAEDTEFLRLLALEALGTDTEGGE